MATFVNTLKPTPFGLFDEDGQFQSEADAMVTFVKRKLGDDILSVELTKRQIWACFEESAMEYSRLINEHQADSQLANLLGVATGSLVSGSHNVGPHGFESRYARENVEFLLRRAEPYAMEAGIGGSYNTISGSIQLQNNKQDYDIYTELKDDDGNVIYDKQTAGNKSKLRVFEVFHFSPQAAYRFFDTTSAINYLNNEFSFESFTPETVFYVLPVFEDILRAGQMDLSNRVRRSNYSYRISGTKIRIYPKPTTESPKKLWMRVAFQPDAFNPAYEDDTIFGVNSLANVPYGNLKFATINSMGRQWIRQYTLANSKELLGLVRSKFSTVPIPGADLTLNGSDLVSQGREEKEKLTSTLKETLDKLTYASMMESEATAVEAQVRLMKMIPMPIGKAIFVG